MSSALPVDTPPRGYRVSVSDEMALPLYVTTPVSMDGEVSINLHNAVDALMITFALLPRALTFGVTVWGPVILVTGMGIVCYEWNGEDWRVNHKH